jgi:hypothetical protein
MVVLILDYTLVVTNIRLANSNIHLVIYIL